MMACAFLSDFLIHLHQGLLSSSPNVDVNQTAVAPDVVCLLVTCTCTRGDGYKVWQPTCQLKIPFQCQILTTV